MFTGHTYDDILLIPTESLESRSTPSLKTRLTTNISMDIPIISANMDTVTGYDLAYAMSENGGCGFLCRDTKERATAELVEKSIYEFSDDWAPAVPTLGIGDKHVEVLKSLVPIQPKAICIDIANAYSTAIQTMVELCQMYLPDADIIVGNVASAPGALFLADLGVHAIKVGIGPGSVCTTRLQTGFGVPQFTAIQMVATGLQHHGHNIPIIADGGLKYSGDIVKAIYAGADSVMSGRFFAGCDESLGGLGYRGMASSEARGCTKQTAEGVSINVDSTGPCRDIIQELCGGILSGMSYAGCKTIEELRFSRTISYVVQTQNGMIESGTRG